MNKYNIKQVTALIGINNHTLRYYDRLGICKPHRSNNNYRYYTSEDLKILKYIKVLKYGGLSLAEIDVILKNKQMLSNSRDNLESTKEIIGSHRKNLIEKIAHYQKIVEIISIGELILDNNECLDKSQIDKLVDETFNEISKREAH